ncbi:MFS transporter [Bacillus sp. FJAT-27245]|uniref:MFS transporter n=1 Tax=Bacillus sp. FJAT-27245 TaxID=1684144 RepID=UPI0006A7B7E0|nr:MFS transporter [Bacillus sp. FJAT-27245]
MDKKLKTFITVFFIGAAYALIYALPFVQYMFYDPLVKSIGATNAQLGFLIMIYGLGNIFGAPIGGWMADKFNHKTIYLAALAGNAALCFFFAYNLSYTVAIFVWIGLAVTSLFAYFPAHVKIVRLLGEKDGQGKVFGLAEAAGGVGSIIVNSIALYLFARAASEVGGFKLVVLGYGIASVIVCVILWFLIENPGKAKAAEVKKDKVTAGDFLTVLKHPGTWFTGIAIFSVYSLYVSLSYFTPYFTSVLGVSVTFAGAVAIVRTYLIRIVGAPLGGMLGDKMKSVSKAILISGIGAIAVILVIMNVPVGTSTTILITLTLLVSLFTYIGRANMFAVQAEVKIPEKFSATAAGITCAIGFSPDLFQFTLFGNWLDKYGNQGYQYIFIYTIAVLIIGVVNSFLSIKYKKKVESQEAEILEAV